MANKRIKGLTVEIGGDTTKLGKALESVERKTNDLTAELGEIDRLLKFNPGNTELLAQKQKVLGSIVESTAEKLEKLKEAEGQVQEQFERGEASEEQVRALQREIVQTESKMENYKETIEETNDALKKKGDTTETVKGALQSLGSAAATAAKVGLQAAAAATTAVVGGLVAAAEASREYRTEMGKLEAAFTSSGHSSDTASESFKALYAVIGETDQSVEAAQQIALLAESEKDVAEWSELAAGVVGKFGDALQPETFFEAANETIKLGEATGAYVQMLEGVGMDVDAFNEGLAKCKTEQEKQAYMLSVTQSALGSASAAYREANAEIIRSNEATEAWNSVLAEVGAPVDSIISDVKLLGASMLTEFVPGINQATEAFRGVINGAEGASDDLGAALSDLIGQLLNKATEIAPTVVEVGTGLITSLTTNLIGMAPDLVTTAADLFVAIIDGLAQATPEIAQAIVDTAPALTAALGKCAPDLLKAAINLFFELVKAIPKVLVALDKEIPAIGRVIISAVGESLADLPGQMLDVGEELVTGIWQGMTDKVGWLKKKISGFTETVLDSIKDFFDIHSPSGETAYFGEMLDEGLAMGVEDNANAPIKALRGLSDDMLGEMDSLNGLTLERQLNHTFSGGPSATQNSGILDKLDKLLQAVERGQVLTIDGDLLVGSTAGRYDASLGQRRALAARGAL